MRSIAPPTGTSVKKNSTCFSSKSIGVDQPPSAAATSFEANDIGPKLIQSPVVGCSRRALENDSTVSRNRLDASSTTRLAVASLRLRLVFVPSARVNVD